MLATDCAKYQIALNYVCCLVSSFIKHCTSSILAIQVLCGIKVGMWDIKVFSISLDDLQFWIDVCLGCRMK